MDQSIIRWVAVKKFLTEKYGIVMNFSEGYNSYYGVYKYLTKSDKEVYHTDGHPDLSEVDARRTSQCIRAYRKARALKPVDVENSSCSNAKKPRRE